MTPQPPLLTHQTLSARIKGKRISSTTQYLGLKYASIPARFQHCIPLDSLPTDESGIFDATRYGPSCPQKRGGREYDASLIGDFGVLFPEGMTKTADGEEIVLEDVDRMDEFECLNLNVIVPDLPETTKDSNKPLPVFLWVHGGALSIGASSWPQYHLTRLVNLSQKLGKPVIGVSINYRLGVLGFLASKEMGIPGNFGYRDQMVAMRWVKKHIAGFGGDPENVTAVGESAGGISLSTLLCVEGAEEGGQGLFDRVVIMSGDVTLRKPRGWEWHEETCREQFKFLGLEKEDLDIKEKGKKIREWDVEDLCAKLPIAQHFCAVIDGELLRKDVTFKTMEDGSTEIHKRRWCKECVVGDTRDDGTILGPRVLLHLNPLTRLHSLCSQYLTSQETQHLLTAYNIPLPSSALPSLKDDPQLSARLLTLISELRFHLPTLIAHKGWISRSRSSLAPRTPKARRYHFHTPNPFAGPNRSLASHELDVAFMLQNYSYAANGWGALQQKAADDMAETYIRFVNGEGWGAVGFEGPAREGEIVVFTADGVEKVSEEEYDTKWRDGRGKVLLEVGPEKLWRLVEDWQGVRPDIPGDDGGVPHLGRDGESTAKL